MSNIQVGITDHLDPEVEAMVMAMYSRSYAPIEGRIPSSEESIEEHKKKLGKFYIGYNHKSVGQLGDTTIWIEGVSMLAAKAIENHPLYNGQESSTRYIDFSSQPMFSPNEDIVYWQEKFRAFYIKAVPLVIEKLKLEFPLIENVKYVGDPLTNKDSAVWENTIKARAFDICRGILPAGCTTNVAFKGTFDTINDHFGEMLYHPCQEMRDIAETVLTKLKEKYPYAAMDIDKLEERHTYVNNIFFYQCFDVYGESTSVKVVTDPESASFNDLEFFHKRDKFSKLSRFISNFFRIRLIGLLDFGSYRDIHRHRNGYIGMEALSIDKGFHEFYLNNLTPELTDELTDILSEYEDWYENIVDLDTINGLTSNELYDLQYCTPMGYRVAIDYNCDINQALYLMELRSGKTVHQTLRELIQSWVIQLKEIYPTLDIHADMDKDNFTLKRGNQTFDNLMYQN